MYERAGDSALIKYTVVKTVHNFFPIDVNVLWRHTMLLNGRVAKLLDHGQQLQHFYILVPCIRVQGDTIH